MNARWLASQGYDVHAIDISKEAITQASEVSQGEDLICFEARGFMTDPMIRKFDVVFDKGCMHSFSDQESYERFAFAVANHLHDGGVWISVSSNSDNPESLDDRKQYQYPRMSLRDIAFSVEPHFEILEIKRGVFGKKNDFLSWLGVYQKRSFHY